ncbi:MAG: hypothetical protein K0V04_06990 [Deltaproteobacteria bacterium]|nr:hypothetical protein [Deltaproteobacteria bacterium]
MNRSVLLLACLGPLACSPRAVDAGVIEQVDTEAGSGGLASEGDGGSVDAADDGGTSSDGTAQDEPEWSLYLGEDLEAITMNRVGNGVVVALEPSVNVDIDTDTVVTQISRTGETVWSRSVPGARVLSVAPLPEGGFVLGGASRADSLEERAPMVWLLDDSGAVLREEVVGETGRISHAMPVGGGLALLNYTFSAVANVAFTDMQLQVQWTEPVEFQGNGPGSVTHDDRALFFGASNTTANSVLTVEVGPTGLEMLSLAIAGDRMGLSGSGDDLSLQAWNFEDDFIALTRWSDGRTVEIPIEGLESTWSASDRRGNFVLVRATVGDDPGHLELREVTEDGEVAVRLLDEHSPSRPRFVEIADDSSIYIAATEGDDRFMPQGVWLHRRWPSL